MKSIWNVKAEFEAEKTTQECDLLIQATSLEAATKVALLLAKKKAIQDRWIKPHNFRVTEVGEYGTLDAG